MNMDLVAVSNPVNYNGITLQDLYTNTQQDQNVFIQRLASV